MFTIQYIQYFFLIKQLQTNRTSIQTIYLLNIHIFNTTQQANLLQRHSLTILAHSSIKAHYLFILKAILKYALSNRLQKEIIHLILLLNLLNLLFLNIRELCLILQLKLILKPILKNSLQI